MKILYIFVLLSIFYGKINSQTCEKCYSAGEVCTSLPNGAPQEDIYYSEGSCSDGYVCAAKTNGDLKKDWICIKSFGENEACTSENSCSLGLICESNKCLNARFAAVGESCSQNTDCSGSNTTCTNSVCTSTGNCEDYNDCAFGSSCFNKKCVVNYKLGETCETDITKMTNQCQNGLICVVSESNSGTIGTCTNLFTKPLGSHCSSSDECNQNESLYCTKDNLCEEYIEPKQPTTNCSLTKDSCDDYHQCSCDGKCYQSSPLPTQFGSTFAPLIQCILENQCIFVNNAFSSKSCITKNCGPKFCAYNTASVFDNPLSCGNSKQVNEYCDVNNSSKLLNSSIFSLLILFIISFLLI